MHITKEGKEAIWRILRNGKYQGCYLELELSKKQSTFLDDIARFDIYQNQDGRHFLFDDGYIAVGVKPYRELLEKHILIRDGQYIAPSWDDIADYARIVQTQEGWAQLTPDEWEMLLAHPEVLQERAEV